MHVTFKRVTLNFYREANLSLVPKLGSNYSKFLSFFKELESVEKSENSFLAVIPEAWGPC
jgi:hypothetical protein